MKEEKRKRAEGELSSKRGIVKKDLGSEGERKISKVKQPKAPAPPTANAPAFIISTKLPQPPQPLGVLAPRLVVCDAVTGRGSPRKDALPSASYSGRVTRQPEV